jgi:ABC-2 type transport system permease protein
MSRIISDIKSYGKMYMRSKVGAFFTFVFPILLILMFGAIYSTGGDQKVTLPVQNLDDGPHSKLFLSILNSTGAVNIEEIAPTENLTAYFKDNSLTMALVIPRGFSDQVNYSINTSLSQSANVILYGDPTQTTVSIAQAVIGATAVAFNDVLLNSTEIVYSEVQPPPATESFKFLDFFLPGVIGITVMTNCLFAMTSICAEYRQRGFFKLLATTRLKKHEWLISKYLWYSLILLASLLTTVAVAKLAFKIEANLTPMALLMIPVGAFVFTSMGMLIGVAVKDPESGVALANAVGFPMMFLSGSFFPLDVMPGFLKAIAAVLPLTYFNNGLRDTMVSGNTTAAMLNAGILLAVGLVFFALSSKLMSWKEK